MVYTESAHSTSFDKLLRSAVALMVAGCSHVGQRTGVISDVAHTSAKPVSGARAQLAWPSTTCGETT